jgi:xylan 1,4-beta-xylosidase
MFKIAHSVLQNVKKTEEDGPVKEPFHGGFGLIAAGGIKKPSKKPSYNGYALLHKLGHQRIPNPASNVFVTQDSDGRLVLAVWNLIDPDKSGAPRSVHFTFQGLKAGARTQVTRLDGQHKFAGGLGSHGYAALSRTRTD